MLSCIYSIKFKWFYLKKKNVLTKSAGHARSKLEVEQKQWDVYWLMTKVSFISTENQHSLKLHTIQQIIYVWGCF